MKKSSSAIFLLLLSLSAPAFSQEIPQAEVYLLTCGPGTETYSHYGHSALRIVIPGLGSDQVYNWGVFDFSTPNFGWKFAKGDLEYMLGVDSYDSFLQTYIYEGRWVISQRVNIENDEIDRLFNLITENLKPGNVKYRYDFFYDDCSTRIRDLFEQAIGEKLLYPFAESEKEMPTFRELTSFYQRGYPWLTLGIDLLMGSPADTKASFRDRMFLPFYLQSGLSDMTVRRETGMIPLLQNPVYVVDLPSPEVSENFFNSPSFIFTLVLVVLVIITALVRGKKVNRVIDLIIFFLFSILALIMIFFNFFSGHPQLNWNLNIIWLSPFIIPCFISLLFDRDWLAWFRVTFFLAVAYLAFIVILPQHLNQAFVPMGLILILRSSVRSGYTWNPLTLPYLTEL